jgi:hypothetical protein
MPVAGPTGKVLYLAGRAAEAIPRLRAGVADCRVLWHPFAHVESAFFLGRALEDGGDKAGACVAYARVLDRWGSATPRSRTASAARQRSSRLGCARLTR